ncbi:MAG: hypothetical protein M1812_002183 [Candelaria pacifica]|nr:MAG: hypothetical protein M1812_002183 [Candelaria pacifica]
MDPIGISLGTVALALQLTESVRKLQSFWSSVRDAPKEVSEILLDLGVVREELEHIVEAQDTARLLNVNASLACRSLERCKGRISILESSVNELKAGFDGSRGRLFRTSLIAALRKDRILQFQASLDRAKTTVMLTNQNFTNMLQLHSIDMLCRSAAILQRSPPKPSSSVSPVSTSAMYKESLPTPVLDLNLEPDAFGRRTAILMSNEAPQLGTLCRGESWTFKADAAQLQSLVSTDNVIKLQQTPKTAGVIDLVEPHAVKPQRTGLTQLSHAEYHYSTLIASDRQLSSYHTVHRFFAGTIVYRRTVYRTQWKLDGRNIERSENEREHQTQVSVLLVPHFKILGRGFMASLSLQKQSIATRITTHPIRPRDSPIFHLCQQGNAEGVLALLRVKAASPFDMDPDGNTLLHYAAESLQVDLCRLLIKMGARGDVVNLNKQRSPLHLAASAKYGCFRADGRTAVDSFETIRALVQYGHVDPGLEDVNKRTAVSYLYGFRYHSTAMHPLKWLRHQEEFEVEFIRRGRAGYTTLMDHVATWYLEGGQSIEVLVELGADVNETIRTGSKKDYTALHLAVDRLRRTYGSATKFEKVRALLRAGANAHALTADCHSVTDFMRYYNKLEEWRELLIGEGIDLRKFMEKEVEVHKARGKISSWMSDEHVNDFAEGYPPIDIPAYSKIPLEHSSGDYPPLLPRGWEFRRDGKGNNYYLNHLEKYTTWTYPREPVSTPRTPRGSITTGRQWEYARDWGSYMHVSKIWWIAVLIVLVQVFINRVLL